MQQHGFFVSQSNSIAYQLVAQFNMAALPPVSLIYGTQGSGKTMLLTLLQRELAKRELRYRCIDAQDFSQKYAYAAQKKLLPSFRHNMRSVPILLCDNLERICGKVRSLEELVFTCEEIWGKGGHVIATLNMERLLLEGFGPRMASRLCLGVSAHIAKPSHEEIKDFLTWCQDTEEEPSFFQGWHFGQIVRHFQRRPQGAGSTEEGNILGNFEEIATRMMMISKRYYSIDEDDLRGPSCSAKIVQVRTVQYYILQSLGYTQREIAAYYRQGRPSVARGCAKMKTYRDEYANTYDLFRSKLVSLFGLPESQGKEKDSEYGQ